MSTPASNLLDRKASPDIRHLADQAFSRTAGAPLVTGNRVRILKDARENYPAWREAIASATTTVHFESYILHDDQVGNEFAELLMSKARDGVRVRLIYDWLGGLGSASFLFWRRMRKAGVEVRCFNPPRLDSPLGWVSRDHRKMITVDGQVGFVTGLCVGDPWVGDPARGIVPWRDTGIMLEGPAVCDIEQSFADMWASLGSPIPDEELRLTCEALVQEGNVAVRVVATHPNTAGLYRLDQLIAALARRSIWLTDAYFVGTPAYVQALRAAAQDGVDVRILLPRTSDVPVVRAISRVGYRAMLEAGVRIFEWDGSMLHAKTAVADGRWARVGSTNLNVASWLGNCELDVVVENDVFSRNMEKMYLEDLAHSTEIVLNPKRKVRPADSKRARLTRPRGVRRGAGRAAGKILTVGSTVGTAISGHRVLGPTEVPVMLSAALAVLGIAVLAAYHPRVIGLIVAVLFGWLAVSLVIQGLRLLFRGRKRKE